MKTWFCDLKVIIILVQNFLLYDRDKKHLCIYASELQCTVQLFPEFLALCAHFKLFLKELCKCVDVESIWISFVIITFFLVSCSISSVSLTWYLRLLDADQEKCGCCCLKAASDSRMPSPRFTDMQIMFMHCSQVFTFHILLSDLVTYEQCNKQWLTWMIENWKSEDMIDSVLHTGASLLWGSFRLQWCWTYECL